ncbi:MAG: vitamin B12 dependent-methionine synthase activation domain-containing protein [bacterium]
MIPESGRTTPFDFKNQDIRPGMPAILARLKTRAGAPFSLDGAEETAEAAIEKVYAREKHLLLPRAIFNIHKLHVDVTNGEILIPGHDIYFKSPLLLQKISGESLGAFFVASIGGGLEERARALGAEGKIAESFILDGIASEAVERAVELLHEYISRAFDSLRKRLSPGYPGWDLAEQKKIFAILGEDAVEKSTGVVLTDSCYMQPEKSVSGLILPGV